MAHLAMHHVFRRSRCNNLSACLATLRPKIDDIVGTLDDIEIVLNYEHSVAKIDEPLQHVQKVLYIFEVESGCRLVEDVECLACLALAQFFCKLDALRFPPESVVDDWPK